MFSLECSKFVLDVLSIYVYQAIKVSLVMKVMHVLVEMGWSDR